MDDTHGIAGKALAIPEILSTIFGFIYEDDGFWYSPDGEDEDRDLRIIDQMMGKKDGTRRSYGRDGVLLRCALVSHLWFDEALPYLWRTSRQWFSIGDWYSGSLPALFAKMTPSRRQLYANLVEDCLLVTVSHESTTAGEADEAFRGVHFPKLQSITMMLPGYGSKHVPLINSPNVTMLELDPSFDYYPDTYRVDGEELDIILDQVAVCSASLHSTI